MISVDILLQRFSYDMKTGIIIDELRNRPAGTRHPRGYRYLSLTIGGRQRKVLAHRVAWAIVTGAWPKSQIDHRNGIRDDNRFVNLREATPRQNQQNRKAAEFFGASWHSSKAKWRAVIRVEGRHAHLGYFETPEEAHAAYLAAKAIYHPFQPTLRKP